MKKFAKNIVGRIQNNPNKEVTKHQNYVSIRWGKSHAQVFPGYIYQLSWMTVDGTAYWQEFNDSFNRVENTGMTCICDLINPDGDGLYVKLKDLEDQKEEILALAAKIYAKQLED